MNEVKQSDHYATPKWLYDQLNTAFALDDDPCPLGGHRGPSGLERSWGASVYLNPPYSNIEPWLENAFKRVMYGMTTRVVALLPAWTDREWWHKYVSRAQHIMFIRGRVSFVCRAIRGRGHPLFASVIVVWDYNLRHEPTQLTYWKQENKLLVRTA